jgi:mRNA interferase RelE/StbE
MKSIFVASFLSDVKKLRDAKVQDAVRRAIENVEAAQSNDQIRSLKRLSGQRNSYRIRVGNWRIGIVIDGNAVTFVRCLNRREIYRFFP